MFVCAVDYLRSQVSNVELKIADLKDKMKENESSIKVNDNSIQMSSISDLDLNETDLICYKNLFHKSNIFSLDNDLDLWHQEGYDFDFSFDLEFSELNFSSENENSNDNSNDTMDEDENENDNENENENENEYENELETIGFEIETKTSELNHHFTIVPKSQTSLQNNGNKLRNLEIFEKTTANTKLPKLERSQSSKSIYKNKMKAKNRKNRNKNDLLYEFGSNHSLFSTINSPKYIKDLRKSIATKESLKNETLAKNKRYLKDLKEKRKQIEKRLIDFKPYYFVDIPLIIHICIKNYSKNVQNKIKKCLLNNNNNNESKTNENETIETKTNENENEIEKEMECYFEFVKENDYCLRKLWFVSVFLCFLFCFLFGFWLLIVCLSLRCYFGATF